ncbi:Hsp70 family protein, partial [Rhodococcus sp. CX]|uniref:Hsp70 family protein n=1 Tax=Rhodococcus sp. CX TaxID=2789880 RepID=UPI001E2C0B19
FDFGGGTCDVAVLTATDEWTFEVLRAGGDTALGGKNLDATISRWVEQHLADENPQLVAWLRSPAGLDARRTLDDQIRRAKELLSDAPSATIRVTGHGADLTLTLTREEFEQLIEPQIGRGVQLAATVLREAGIDRGRLQALYLTGGSSRIPYVHRRLAELGPIATLDDPKTVVARNSRRFLRSVVRCRRRAAEVAHDAGDRGCGGRRGTRRCRCVLLHHPPGYGLHSRGRAAVRCRRGDQQHRSAGRLRSGRHRGFDVHQ